MDRINRRLVVTVGLLGCISGLAWIVWGGNLGPTIVGNSNFVGAVASVVSLGILITTTLHSWSPAANSSTVGTSSAALMGGLSEGEVRALEYLTAETLRHWGQQAVSLRIRTPAPATVAWRWASDEIAVPPTEVPKTSRLIPHGKVELLRTQLFNKLPEGRARIVILGEAGAGKTCAMLLLLIDILEQRKSADRDPVVVWLPLNSWDPNKESVLDYASSIMLRDYPGLASPIYGNSSTAGRLVRSGRITLFMDGLDEIPEGLRGLALSRIDQDTRNFSIVLTSRSEEYSQALANGRLYDAAVIELLPLTIKNAGQFLIRGQIGSNRMEWRKVAEHLVTHKDSVAAQTLTTPLSLALVRDSFGGPKQPMPSDLLDEERYTTSEALLRYIVANYLNVAISTPREREHSLFWLSWIAHRLGEKRDIAWWTIPTWIPRRDMNLARGVIGLGVGAILGSLAGGYAGNVAGGPAYIRICAIIFGSFAALVAGGLFAWGRPLEPEILAGLGTVGAGPRALSLKLLTGRQFLRILRAVFAEACHGCWLGGGIGAIVGLIVGILYGLIGATSEALAPDGNDIGNFILTIIFFGLFLAFVCGLLGALFGCITAAITRGFIGNLWSLLSRPLATSPLVTPDSVRRYQRRYQTLTGIFAGIGLGISLSLLVTIVLAATWRYWTFNGGRMECLAEGNVHCGLGQGDIAKVSLAVALAGALILAIILGFFDDLALASLVLFCTGKGAVSFRRLLKRASEAGILRQAGAVYEFRHYIFQKYLASTSEPSRPRSRSAKTTRATE